MTAQLLVNGAVLGAIIALMSIGFNFIFGILRVVNYWHGELYMFGAVIVYYLCVSAGLSYPLSMLLAVVAVAMLGRGTDRAIFAHLRGNLIGGAVAALALMMLTQNIMWYIFGPVAKIVPAVVTGTVNIAGARLPAERLLVIGISSAVIVFTVWFVRSTKLGKAIRAVQQDREAALTLGIDVNRICGITFSIAAGLAASAGGLMATIVLVSPPMGGVPLILSLIVVILGGMGSLVGGIIAAFIIGFQQSFTGFYFGPEFAFSVSAVVALVMLAVRPRGLAGYVYE